MPLAETTVADRDLALDADRIAVSVCTIPTDAPESDGTLAWSATTVVIVEVRAGAVTGLGYAPTSSAAAAVVQDVLAPALTGVHPMDVPEAWMRMRRAVRNIGQQGIAASAIAATDIALWDLKARLLDVPLVSLLGGVRPRVEAYGSGGFTSYTDDELRRQLGGWVADGFSAVKMKVGREPAGDLARVRAARSAIGRGTRLFVDANGAYARKQALAFAEAFAAQGVTWFEEPVSSDDVEGLRLLRDAAPGDMEVAAGEYAWDVAGARRLLDAGAVDVLQADATRCAGISGFLRIAALCEARGIPLSAHTAPSAHLHVCCAAVPVRHMEYFHDHARLEPMLFDGVVRPEGGALAPDLSRPGLGLELKRADAARYAA